jgi:hypothetical protein
VLNRPERPPDPARLDEKQVGAVQDIAPSRRWSGVDLERIQGRLVGEVDLGGD